jgi:hypothetical protein
MRTNCRIDRVSAPIVQVAVTGANAPQRRGAHFAHPSVGLPDAVTQRTHIVQ